MSAVFTGRCLCGGVTYKSSSEPKMQANCHCDDCRRSSGGAFASFAFVTEDDLSITGEVASYQHESDKGSEMTKMFCPNCGTPLFTKNSASAGRLGVRVGSIDDASWFEPQASVYTSRKIPSTPVYPGAKIFDKMPG
jgi:hypothetical protein